MLLGTPCDFSGELMPPIDSAARAHGMNAMVTSFNGQYIGYITADQWYDPPPSPPPPTPRLPPRNPPYPTAPPPRPTHAPPAPAHPPPTRHTAPHPPPPHPPPGPPPPPP